MTVAVRVCERCELPRAPYGYPISMKEAERYCWGDHEVRDLKAAVAHTLDCRDVGCERCLQLRAEVSA